MTCADNESKQCLALDPHPLRLELLAHVGYVTVHPSSVPVAILPRNTSANSQTTAITFLAQWHPLIAPQRNDLRPEYNGAAAKSNGMF
jgi:phosphoribosylcarboxyaminoimidazole (NCAIR) mutase